MSAPLASARSPASLRRANLAASAVVVAIACAGYVAAPYNQARLAATWATPWGSFSGAGFLWSAALLYVGALALHFLADPDPRPSKSLRALALAGALTRFPGRRRQPLSPDDRLAVLATLLKAYYAPMMAMFLLGHCLGAFAHAEALLADPNGAWRTLFDRDGYWLAMQLILFVDVLVFTLGYLVELDALGNRIRSVDPTLLGWVAALLCYPPFNSVSGAILGSQVSDFPRFDDPMAHAVFNAALLTLLALYAWSSAALGFKASNLTHRGIVAKGPYAFVRHPAYAAKNLAWWIGSAPLVSAAFARSLGEGALALASVAGWTLLYVLRALTEEDHLRRVDGEYLRYADRVRRRFLPGLL